MTLLSQAFTQEDRCVSHQQLFKLNMTPAGSGSGSVSLCWCGRLNGDPVLAGRRPAVWERDAEADAVPGRDGGWSGGRGLAGRAAPDSVSGQNRPPDPQDRR